MLELGAVPSCKGSGLVPLSDRLMRPMGPDRPRGEIARQAGHSPTMTLDVYAHVFDEFEVTDRLSAEEQIRRARKSLNVSVLCPSGPDEATEDQETPANPQSPICLPRISFMISSVPPPIGPRRASRTARSIPYSRM
jgi:hypothetical protein